jgi:hypothetical protein
MVSDAKIGIRSGAWISGEIQQAAGRMTRQKQISADCQLLAAYFSMLRVPRVDCRCGRLQPVRLLLLPGHRHPTG